MKSTPPAQAATLTIESDCEPRKSDLPFICYHEKTRSPIQIDDDLLQIIKKGVVGHAYNGERFGRVHTNTLSNYPKYVKLEKIADKGTPDRRRKKVEKICDQPYEHQHDPREHRSFRNFRLTETLVYAQLHNEGRWFRCPTCKSKSSNTADSHGDWFEIDVEESFEVIGLWRWWLMDCKPYDNNGYLTPYWRWRCDEISQWRQRRGGEAVIWKDWLARPTFLIHHCGPYLGPCLDQVELVRSSWKLYCRAYPRVWIFTCSIIPLGICSFLFLWNSCGVSLASIIMAFIGWFDWKVLQASLHSL